MTKNRIISKEHIIIEGFKHYKIIELYRNSKLFYVFKTDNIAMDFRELKRQFRHNVKINHAGERFKRLAVVDNENIFYSLHHCNYYENMASEYATMKRLKEQLEKEKVGTIICETATNKKEYQKKFKIVYVNFVAWTAI